MDRIEVTTSHNIVVRFELASLLQRMIASILDFIILIMFTILINFLGLTSGSSVFYWLLIFPVWSFYHLAFEIFNNGQSLGKKILKIRVVSLEGRTAKVNDYLIRWVFRLIEVLPSLGTVAMIFISSSHKNQRIGDILANTSVVKQRNENNIQLSSIQNIDSEQEMMYPGITQFSDKDMLLVKEAINRYIKNPHSENKTVLNELTSKIAERLQIDPKGLQQLGFLKRVLYEYVLLTR